MSWSGETVAVADLASLPAAVTASGLAAPAVIVVGEVVSMRRELFARRGVEELAAGRSR